jgi:hypothetical protein
MNWFKQILREWLLSEDSVKVSRARSRGANAISTIDDVESNGVDSDPTMRFKIYSARGGKIVEFSRYDRQKDRNEHDLYIIGKDEDFGERIARIAMLESMKD